jgi:hypothetical protein
MESLPARGGPLYWLLVGALLPLFNWWLGLWVVVLAREATPLLVVVPVLLAAESVALGRWLRGGNTRTRPIGTAVLLLVTTFVWSCLLTLVALSVQENLFTF